MYNINHQVYEESDLSHAEKGKGKQESHKKKVRLRAEGETF